jgi:hypothetical protein
MRVSLLEYINYDVKKFLSRWESEGRPYIDIIGEDGSGFISWLEGYDPSPAKKYVNWMIVRYLRGDISRLEDIPSRISGALRVYMGLGNKKKLRPEHRDINRIIDIEDIIDEYRDISVTSKSEQREKYISDGSAELIFDDAEYRVIVPKTSEASCYYGVNTRWCTASRDNNMFDNYNRDGPLYIILHKPSNTRWQFHFESDQFMDERDASINLISFFTKHRKIFNIFKKLGLVDYDGDSWRIYKSYYNKDLQLHRTDGPAVEYPDGTKRWYLNDKLHRTDGGPAVEYPDGTKRWYLNGKLHRTDGGPAIELSDGTKYWYLNGELHRSDGGPAIEYPDGRKYWWLNGERHRTDGPAFENSDGTKAWYLNGSEYSFSEWKKMVDNISVSESILEIRRLAGIN